MRIATGGHADTAFRHLRWRLVVNSIRSLGGDGSRLRLLMILACSTIFWTGLFGLFFEGFQFLGSFVKLSNEVVEYLFSTFFLSLLIMLVFSTGIIIYSGLFHSRESTYLLSTPAPTDRIFAYKFVEAMAFSSWGFLLLGSPMMVAYGITVEAPWPFYALFLAFLFAFVLIPGSLGAIGAFVVANVIPRRTRTLLVVSGLALAAGIGFLARRLLHTPGDVLSDSWLDSLLGQLAFSQHELLPSRWMSKGLIEAARGDWRNGLFYLGVTAANASMAYLVAAVVSRDLYRRGYSRVQGGRSARRHHGWYAIDAICHRLLWFLSRPIRLLILKDLRAFRRDPAQWSQFLIFFGLLAFYFINIRRLGYHVQDLYFRNMLGFLNLAVTALILSTFTSRFIFPLLSLEGRNFWILGLLPVSRAQVLWGKFAFSSGISLIASEGLILISDTMLGVGPLMTTIHVVLVVVLCLGLSSISVGLGARMPNLKEDDPSKIAAGFGGTLNLLVSLVYIFLVVATLALPCHIFLSDYQDGSMFGRPDMERFRFWLMVSMFGSVILGVVATLVPLRIGIRAFERMEF